MLSCLKHLDAHMSFCDLCGGLGESEKQGIPWRLASDLSIVSYNKSLMSLAEYLHRICTIHGVASFELLDHVLLQKQYPVA